MHWLVAVIAVMMFWELRREHKQRRAEENIFIMKQRLLGNLPPYVKPVGFFRTFRFGEPRG